MTNFYCDGYETITYGDLCKKGIPRLYPENEKFWKLFKLIEPGLLFHTSSYDYTSIDCILRWYRITDPQEIDWIFKKIVTVIYVLEEIRAKKNGA